MTNVLILGAYGSIARVAIDLFLKETDAQLTLYLRNSRRLKNMESNRVRVIEGDVMDIEKLKEAMISQNVVYANLAGNLEQMAKTVVEAMDETGLKRLIWISSMGIYDEVPGEKHGSILNPYRKSAAIIEASDLDYTILRPGWFTNKDEIDYETTQKGEPFKGHDVSRKSLARLVVKLAVTPGMEVRCSLGVKSMISYPFAFGFVYLLLFFMGRFTAPMFIIVVAWGVMFALGNNISQFWMTSAAPEAPEFANGLFLSVGNLGITVGTAVGGLFISGMGTQYVVFSGLLFLVLSLGFILIRNYTYSPAKRTGQSF